MRGMIVTRKKATKALPMHKTYLSFLEKVSLLGVGLDCATASIDRTALAEAVRSHEPVELSLDGNFEVLSNIPDNLVVGGVFKLRQLHQKNLAKPLLQIDCSFSAMFRLGESVDNETAVRFANTEAKFVIWPYLRHFIADTSYRMAIAPILLPLTTALGPTTKSEKH
jgi:hypothetical protein